jgi:hypothetical protein
VPAGPNGSHTLDQWIQAGKKLEHKNHVTADQRQVIESIAKFSGYMDQIQHHPDSLNLTPDEQALAQRDLPTLAFVKAAGTTLNLNDPNLQPVMLQIAKQAPALFALLQRKDVKIWTDVSPVKADTVIGRPPGGQFLHVTVDGNPVSEAEISSLVQRYSLAYGEDRPSAVAGALIPGLHLENDASLQALMKASDNARMQYAKHQIDALTSGPNPDMKAALSSLNTKLAGFFNERARDSNESARDAFWNSSGKPYFTPQRKIQSRICSPIRRSGSPGTRAKSKLERRPSPISA